MRVTATWKKSGTAAVTAAAIVVGLTVATGTAVVSSASAAELLVSSDTLRTAWDSAEPGLSPSSVGASDFGQVFDATLDGQIYAQPLVDATSVYITTEKAKAYALDRETGATLWTRAFGSPFQAATVYCGDLTPDLGSTSTGVVDPATRTWYFTTKLAVGTGAAWWLQAVSLDTGLDRPGFPKQIQGSPTNDPTDVFPAKNEHQRPGLLLINGVVYLAFGAHCDVQPYKGYVVGVNATTAAITAFWTTVVGSGISGAGIWQSGGGLVSDGPGRIFLSTGNGFFGGNQSGTPGLLGEAVVRLKVNADGSLSTDDWFTSANAATLDANDQDLGSGAPTALPVGFGTTAHPKLMVVQGKEGRLFVLDRDDLGGYKSGAGGSDRIVSSLSNVGSEWGHLAFFGAGGGYAYEAPSGAPLTALAYGVDGNGVPRFSTVGSSTGAFGYTSGSPVVTSNGTDPASGVVWVVYSGGSNGAGGELRAYDAVPSGGVLNLRWHAAIGNASKFSQPATDGGRVFVGTRDGHLKAFGRPQTTALATTPVELGSSAVGATATGTATVTASRGLTITAMTTTAPFAVTAPTLPLALTTGQSLALPVSFSPTAPVDSSATVTITTDAGTFSVGLHGLGTAAGVTSTPAAVTFANQPTALPRTTSVVIRNTGTTTTTVTGVTAPTAPFTLAGAPAVGASIAAGASVTVGVTFAPTVVGAASSSFAVTTSTGNVTVPLTGTGVTGASLMVLTPTTLDVGTVAVGQTVTGTFTVANTGNLPLTITKAKAPAGAFSSISPLPEGLVINDVPYTQSVSFTPTAAGDVTSSYEVTSDDGKGAQYVTLVGHAVAVAPSPVAGDWTLNGGATLTGTDLVLTGPTTYTAGSAIYPQAVASADLSVQFTTAITGGTSGADGLAFSLLDPALDTPASLGQVGGALGFGGLHGTAITADTFANATDPSANFTGIAVSNGAYTNSALGYVATAVIPTPLRNATHAYSVTYTGGVLAVTVDGAALMSKAVTLPSNVLLAFSAGTGGLIDTHAIRNVTIGRVTATPPPPPPPPPPPANTDVVTGTTGWTVNGAATASATAFTLTPATANLAGSAVYPTAVSTATMTASFTASLSGGTGADGLTFALLDPAKSTKNSLGATGGALGFGGLSGTAVTLDTAQGTGEPSANFVGVATANAGALRYVATTTAVPALRTGTHAVVVTTVGGHLKVSVDGTQVLDTVVAIPPTALLAFTSGTGSITDVHAVSAISIQAKRSTFATGITGIGWGRAGKAVVSGTGVQLTASTTYASGSTMLTTAYPATGLHVRYTATIAPGTGADGMALALLDSTKSTSLSLGALGGGLGYGGLAGIAVTSDSFQNTGDPGADFIGIANGVKTKTDQLNYVASTASKGGLTVGSHVIDVWTADGKLYVAVDGLVRLSPVLALPTSVRLGFTAGTGGLTDTHSVSNVTVASG